MNLRKGFARLVAVAALFAIVTSIGLLAGSTTHAQQPPYKAYGTGIAAGDVVAASVNGVDCGNTTATAAGEWVLDIIGGDCQASTGDAIDFTLNGEAVDEKASYSDGGTPGGDGFPVATGIPMTLSGAMAPAPTTPAPADTGNAGLGSGSSTSLALALALGAFALATLAGARVATGRNER